MISDDLIYNILSLYNTYMIQYTTYQKYCIEWYENSEVITSMNKNIYKHYQIIFYYHALIS